MEAAAALLLHETRAQLLAITCLDAATERFTLVHASGSAAQQAVNSLSPGLQYPAVRKANPFKPADPAQPVVRTSFDLLQQTKVRFLLRLLANPALLPDRCWTDTRSCCSAGALAVRVQQPPTAKCAGAA